jgi:autotransporter translocation and assembly factor TamB
MKLTISKKTMIRTAVIAVTSVLLYNLPFLLLQDRLLTREVGKKLRKNLAEYGLNVDIGKIHWAGGGKFEADVVSLNELRGGNFLAETEKLVLKINPLALVGNPRDPETVLREIEIFGPRLRLQHFADGTWNFSPLFARKKKGEAKLNLNIVIRNAKVDWEDYRFGKHRFQQVNGRVDLRKYPLISWDLKGKSDLGNDLAWESAGKMRTDQSAGIGNVSFSGLPLDKAYQLLPRQYSCKISAGNARGSVEFGWEKSRFWLEQGYADLERAKVGIPQLQDPLLVKSGEVRFSPRQITFSRSRIFYHGTDLLASGTLLPGKSSVNIAMDSKRARLEDILELFPEIPKTKIQGNAKLRLKITGSINNPVFNGDISVKGARVVSNGETFANISGRASVKRNNIFLDRFSGDWEGTAIRASGVMKNIYSPVLNLDVEADGLSLAQFKLDRLDGMEFKMDEPAAFRGKLSGEWRAPRLSGEAEVNRFEFNRIPAQNLKIKLAWEPLIQKFQILALNGEVWGGSLAVNGMVTIEPQGSRWEVAGKIDGANLSAITIIPDVGLQAENIYADGLWKGSWKQGEPFEPGIVTGVIRGSGISYMNTSAEDVAAVYSWDKGVMRVDSIQAKIGSGRIFGNLVLNQSRLASNISVENIQLGNVFPDKYRLPVNGSFQGSLQLEGNLNDLSASLSGGFKDLVWEDKIIGNVTGNIGYRLREKEISIDHMIVNNPSGDYSVAGNLIFNAESPVMDIRIDTDNLDLKGLMNLLPAERQLKVEGFGRANLEVKGSFAAPSLNGKLYLAQPRFADIMMNEGILEIRGDFNQLEIIQCQLLSEDTRIFLTGLVERNKLSLSIGGNCDNLERFKLNYGGKLLKGKVNFSGDLEGDPRHPVLSARLDGEEIGLGNLKYPQLTAKIRWLAPRLEVDDAVLSDGDNTIRVSGTLYTDNPARFDLGFDVEQFRIEEILKMANLTQIEADGCFNGKINLSGSATEPQCRLTGDITEGTINHVAVNGEVNLFYAAGKLTIEKVLLKHGTGTFKVYGAWERGREMRLKGDLNGFPLETLNSFISKSELKLAGLADADFDLVWGNQVFKGDFTLDGQNLQVNTEMFGSCSLEGSVNKTGVTIKSGNLNIKNGSLALTGLIPWPENLRAVLNMSVSPGGSDTAAELSMILKNIPIDLLNAYAAGFTVKDGVVNGKVNLMWVAGKPQISGKVDCSNAQLNLPDLPLTVKMIQASVVLQKNRASIEQASGTIEKGRVDLSGEIDFSDWKKPYLNLDCTGSKVFFKNFFYDGMGDFTLKLAGAWDDALLMGNVTVYECRVGGLALGRAGGGKGGVWSPRVDLMINIGDKARFRQIGVADLSVEGALHIKGSLMQPELGGEVTSRQGVVTFYSQTFKVSRGAAIFSYSQSFNPFLDVEASLVTPKAEVIVTLKGQLGTDLVPVLSSRPALPQKEIFALLNWSELSGEKPLTIDSVVGGNLGAVTDTLFGDLFFRIGNVLNVDYFYLQTDYRSNEYRLSVGDYITDKLFLSYTTPSFVVPLDKENLEKYNLDYHLSPKISLGGSYSISEGYSWRLSYSLKF